MSPRGSKLAVACVIGLAALGLVALAVPRDFATAGDGFGVYFPVVQGLWRGDGLLAFAPLRHGTGRMPGYPVLVALASFATPDLVRAAQLVNGLTAIALVTVLARALRPLTSSAWEHAVVLAASTLVIATSPVVVRATLEPLPDLAFALAITAALAAHLAAGRAARASEPPASSDVERATGALAPTIDHERTRPLRARAVLAAVFVAGLSSGAATLVRFNGIVLALAGPVALAAVPELRRARLVLTWLAGFVLGVAPLAVPALALAAHGIDYPFLSFAGEPGQGAAGASPRLAARIASLLTALASTPLRVAATTTLPIALLGALGLAIAARRDHAARAVAVASVALVAFLAPVHFEARYLLFVIPPLAVVAVLVVVRACARAGLRARTAHAIVLAGAATLALVQVSIVRDDEAQAARTEADARVLCAALTTRAATETPLVVGLDRGTGGAPERWGHVYTRLRDCPRPTIHDPAILVVDALPNDHGLALRIVAADQGAGLAVRAEGPRDRTRPEGQVPPRPGDGEPQIGPEGQVSPRPGDGEPRLGPEGRGVPPRPSGGEPLLGGHVEPPSPGDGEPLLALELPVRPSSSRCVRRVVDAPAGEGTLVARLGSTPPHVAQLTVRTSSVALRVVAAGLPARAVHAPLVVGRRRRVELELCAADPLRAVGAVVLDGLAIIPSSAPTPIE